jgi:Tannase and feruloyl esterase
MSLPGGSGNLTQTKGTPLGIDNKFLLLVEGANPPANYRGILSPGPGIFGPATTATVVDVEKEALANIQPLVDSMSTNLTTFSQHVGKLIFYHGNSDPWFSPLDTFGYFKDLAAANGGPEAVSKWSQFYFVPGMGHCGGGPGLDRFDLLSAIVNWVEKGIAPTSVVATGRAFPGRSRPLCPLSPARALQGLGKYRGREQLRMPLIFRISHSLLCKRSSDR